jgi:hypothetical protein
VSNPPPWFDTPSTDPVITPPPVREGLPPSFRMRADSHYVDSLDRFSPATTVQFIDVEKIEPRDPDRAPAVPDLTDSIRRYGVLQPLLVQNHGARFRVLAGDRRLTAAAAAELRQVPCIVRPPDDEHAADLAVATNLFDAKDAASEKPPALDGEQAVAELTRCLRALESSSSLLDDPGSYLTRSVAARLIRAEGRRAVCLAQAVRVLGGEVAPQPRRLAIHDVVNGVLKAVEPERCLRNVALKPQLTPSHSRVDADEDLLVGALSGVLLATFALVDGVDARVSVTTAVNPRGEFTFVVSQDAKRMPSEWAASEEAAGHHGATGVLLIKAARRASEVCGGTMTVAAGARGGEIVIAIPTVS